MKASEIRELAIPKTGGVNEDKESTFILKILQEGVAQLADLNETIVWATKEICIELRSMGK